MSKDTLRAVSAIPSAIRAKAYAALNLGQATDLKTIMETLVLHVDQGLISIDQIKAAGAAPSVADPALKAVADSAAKLSLDNAAAIDTLCRDVSTLSDKIKTLADAVADAKRATATVDAGEVSAEVRRAVESAFGPIKAAVTPENLPAVMGAAALPAPVRTDSAISIFGVDAGVDFTVWSGAAPEVDPDFIWTAPILKWLSLADKTGAPVWLGGEKGTGKTQTVAQFAARTGRGFTRINFHKYSTADEYMGATGLVNGQTVFVPGHFLAAFTTPGSVILLDEISNCDPGELAPLNAALERGACRLSIGGQTWNRAPGVLIFGADNTMTTGDQSGRYSGTREMNSALADRFAWVVPFKFLEPDVETAALVGMTGCKTALAREVVRILNVCRAKVSTGEIIDAPSIRAAAAWIMAMPVVGVREAWVASVATRQPAESALALESIYLIEADEAMLTNACA